MNNKKYHKVELLAPAGNLEKLEMAIKYGANAIYLAGKRFNLRNYSDNFSIKDMIIARNITYDTNVKMYVTMNTYSKNDEDINIYKYLNILEKIQPDGIIISDPSIFIQANIKASKIPIHISTQANTTNIRTAIFWKKLGAKRVNLARELTLNEIKEIATNSNIETEVFIHGAMCIAYSGRCIMSNYIDNRESNQGKCIQACRFKYTITEIQNPKKNFPIHEDKYGTYILSSKDLCMIKHIKKLINAGIHSLKIEGRMKGINYVATTTKIYREAINKYNNSKKYKIQYNNWLNQLKQITNRGYCTGFFLKDINNKPSSPATVTNQKQIIAGKILEKTRKNKTLINVKNKIFLKEKISIMTPSSFINKKDIILKIIDDNNIEYKSAQPGSNIYIKTNNNYNSLDIIKKA